LEGRPIETNWINRGGSEDFSQLINYREDFRKGARRFDVGEHSNFIAVPMLSEGIRQILAWGVENIQAYCAGLVDQVTRLLAESEFALAPPEEHAAHLFGIHLPDAGRAPRMLKELKRREVYVSLRGTSVRVSPHVYNTPDDMNALAEALLATRA
jgi:selenocysteine lyase/cysteine desulfurase